MCLRHLCSLSTNNMDDVTVVTHLGRSHGQRCQRGGGPTPLSGGVLTLCSPARASLYTCRWHLYTGGTRTLGSGTCILGSGTCTLGKSICTLDSGTCTLDSGTCTQVAAPAHLVALAHTELLPQPRTSSQERDCTNKTTFSTRTMLPPRVRTTSPPAALRPPPAAASPRVGLAGHASGRAERQPLAAVVVGRVTRRPLTVG